MRRHDGGWQEAQHQQCFVAIPKIAYGKLADDKRMRRYSPIVKKAHQANIPAPEVIDPD
jgi:hypothetical protein